MKPTLSTSPATLKATAAVVLGGGGGLVMSWVVAQHSLIGARWGFILLIAGWIPLWLGAAWGASRLPLKVSLGVVLLLAVALRLAAASGTTPSVSNDVERYAWDAHVQLSGIDPYRYPPDAPQLEHLRTAGFWPSPAECHHLRLASGCTVLNRPNVRTIYPPVAEAWFVIVHVVLGGGARARPWQLAGGFIDDLTIVAMAVALKQQRRDPRLMAWYALSPVAVIEFAGNGHVDGLALGLLVAALIALRRERPTLAGLLIGAATMVKLYPAVALVAGWRRGRYRMVLAAAAVAVASELPHVVAVGSRILGYLPGYLREEHYSTGGRFLLLSLTALPDRVVVGLAIACMLAALLAVLRRAPEPEVGLVFLLGVLIGVTTPVQPWYALTLAGAATVIGAPLLLVVPLAAEPYYASVVLPSAHQVAIGRIGYGVAAVAAAWAYRRGCAGHHRRLNPDVDALPQALP